MFAFFQRIIPAANKLLASSIPIVDENSRFELKYRISYFQYLKVRNALKPYMVMDQFTQGKPTNRYLVRSLYFDTFNYKAYEQKMNGDCDRVKFRLRTYQSNLAETNPIRVELKMRQGNRAVKRSIFVSNEEYMHFIKHRHWIKFQDPITTEFERQCLTDDLRPVILIEYEREGYQTKLKSDLRITFDHRMRSAHANSLFPVHPFFRMLIPRSVILEIKFINTMPIWLEKLVRDQGLKVIANSKYTQALQIARNDLYHPDHAILVR